MTKNVSFIFRPSKYAQQETTRFTISTFALYVTKKTQKSLNYAFFTKKKEKNRKNPDSKTKEKSQFVLICFLNK